MPLCEETCTKHRQNQFAKLFVAITSPGLIKIGVLWGIWKHELLKQLWFGSNFSKNVQEKVNIRVFRISLPQQIIRGCKLPQNQSHVSVLAHFWHRQTHRLRAQIQPVELQTWLCLTDWGACVYTQKLGLAILCWERAQDGGLTGGWRRNVTDFFSIVLSPLTGIRQHVVKGSQAISVCLQDIEHCW